MTAVVCPIASSPRRPLLWAALGSATFHIVVLVALVAGASRWLAPHEPGEADAGRAAATSAGNTRAAAANAASPGRATADDLITRDPAAWIRLMRDHAAEADCLDDAQRLDRLESQSAWLASRDVASIHDAAQRITQLAGGATDRKFAPDLAAVGAPDPDTTVLRDLVKRTEPDGRVVYDWTLIDHEGRSAVTTIDAAAMSPHDLTAARVFAIARDNPNLRTLVNAAQSIIAANRQARSAGEALPR